MTTKDNKELIIDWFNGVVTTFAQEGITHLYDFVGIIA